MTQKLYELDAYLKEFSAVVIDCIPNGDGFKIVLDKTAFFPEGGGQAADTGYLNQVRVCDVQIEAEVIYHYTDLPLKKGEEVIGKIDFERRFNFMQNHTGEHIVSGTAHRLFGVSNVGFHLGEELVTVDFDKELTRSQLEEIEYCANKAVWDNLPVKAYFPTEDELKNINYRSKKEIDGAVRIVDIKGCDICACCAPHVKSTGEIGMIKLLDTERMRGGVRIALKCGRFALCDYSSKYLNISNISALLSARQETAFEAVKVLEDKYNVQLHKNIELKKKLADMTVDFADGDTYCIFVEDCEAKDLQLIADRLYKKLGGIRGAFCQKDGGYAFAICGNDTELQSFFAKFKSELNARGGGRNGMVQGSTAALKTNIEDFFNKAV